MEDIESRVRAYIGEHFPLPEDFAADGSLLDGGIIDSMGVLSIITWLEHEFGLFVDDEDVVPENIDSIANLSRYIDTKLDEQGSAA